MDPNVNREEQRAITKRLLDGTDRHDDAERLANLSEALDEWLTGGGFLPDDWKDDNR